MKHYICLLILFAIVMQANAQLKIGSGANWVITGNASVVLQDLNFENNGSVSGNTGSFKFTGTLNNIISGSNPTSFSILEIAKTNSGKIVLNRNININTSINFISGQIDLNNNNILMASNANISGESASNRIIGLNGGFVEITQNLNNPLSANPGNLGASLTSTANLGNVTIRRGHISQNGTGLAGSIQRYYSIMPANNTGLNATINLKYFDPELNGQTENSLVIYQSSDAGLNWNNISQSSRNASINYVEKSGLNNLSLFTIANDEISVEPVTGLVFTGKRKKSTEVELSWTSQTETNLMGYELQRKLDNEAEFSSRTLINSKAQGGNSLSPLSYSYKDPNAYAGNSLYRLKIIDNNNAISFSEIIMVAAKSTGGGNGGGGNGGGGNGGGGGNPHNNAVARNNTDSLNILANPSSQIVGTPQKVLVGPNPNNGNFWFKVNTIDKPTIASLYTIDGKLLKQFKINNQQQQNVNNISNGIYLLVIPGYEVSKIVVQGNSNANYNTPTTNSKSF